MKRILSILLPVLLCLSMAFENCKPKGNDTITLDKLLHENQKYLAEGNIAILKHQP